VTVNIVTISVLDLVEKLKDQMLPAAGATLNGNFRYFCDQVLGQYYAKERVILPSCASSHEIAQALKKLGQENLPTVVQRQLFEEQVEKLKTLSIGCIQLAIAA
jgi:hypothetical protein